MRLDDPMKALASQQHAVVADWQVRSLGASRTELTRLSRSRTWRRVGTRCLAIRGSDATDAQRAMVAVLDAGPLAILSHTSGASWWGLPGFRLDPLHVSQQEERADLAVGSGRLHDLRAIPRRWTTVLRGVPVARPELVVYQLCGSIHPQRAERALDNAWSRRLVSGRSLRAVLDELAKQGRNGTVVLRELLEDRSVDYVPPASGLESRFQQIVRDAGITTLRRQVDHGGDSWIGRVDFSDSEVPLIAEVQSEAHHAALCDARADAERIAALQAAGYVVVTVWDTDIWDAPTRVVDTIRAARAEALRLARAA